MRTFNGTRRAEAMVVTVDIDGFLLFFSMRERYETDSDVRSANCAWVSSLCVLHSLMARPRFMTNLLCNR